MIPVTKKLIDPNKPDLPKINFPKWLPVEIKVTLEKHLEFMKIQKKSPLREYNDFYAYLVNIFERNKKVFTSVKMKDMWIKLNKLSTECTMHFVDLLLLRIENDYDGGLTLIEKQKAEICYAQCMIDSPPFNDIYSPWCYKYMAHILS